MELFYAEPDNITNDTIILDPFETKHIVQTLKKNKGDTIFITDGLGHLYHSTISENGKQLKLDIKNREIKPRPKIGIVLAVGFVRPNRLDILLEKCTELGVSHFIIFRSQYSNYASSNTHRIVKILRQAIKQSQQFYLPKISIAKNIKDFLSLISGIAIKLIGYSSEASALLSQVENEQIYNCDSVLITIGPEGGFTQDEIELFMDNTFIPVSLGTNRLRTETAAISSISILQSYLQKQREVEFGNG